jgi:hypothetical protein
VKFLVNVNYGYYKLSSALPKIVWIRGSYRNFRHFPLNTVGSSRKNCPSASCVSATTTVCKEVDMFSKISGYA